MIQVDSRRIKKGDTFVALRGISGDGHKFIETAINNGAVKVIAEEGNYSVETLIVEDTRKYLTDYLTTTYKTMLEDMTIIGITGTNGKSTTAHLIYQALNLMGKKCSYIGTIGFFIADRKIELPSLPNTTPDILELYQMFEESYNNGYKYVAMEVSSQALAVDRVKKIKFDYTIFTNISEEHLNLHGTMEKYIQAKQILFKEFNSVALINYDDLEKDKFVFANNKNFFFGFNGGDLKISNYGLESDKTTIEYIYQNKTYKIASNLIGKYNIYNMIATILLLIKLNINIDEINRVVQELKSPEGRMEKISYKNNLIIIDYAHTPKGLKSLLDTIQNVNHNNTYAVFGCAGERDRSQRSVMANTIMANVTKLIITNDDPHEEDPNQIVSDMVKEGRHNNYEICLDRSKAIEKAIALLKGNDILLILGKGHEEYMIVGKEKVPFNDKKEVVKYINNI